MRPLTPNMHSVTASTSTACPASSRMIQSHVLRNCFNGSDQGTGDFWSTPNVAMTIIAPAGSCSSSVRGTCFATRSTSVFPFWPFPLLFSLPVPFPFPFAVGVILLIIRIWSKWDVSAKLATMCSSSSTAWFVGAQTKMRRFAPGVLLLWCRSSIWSQAAMWDVFPVPGGPIMAVINDVSA